MTSEPQIKVNGLHKYYQDGEGKRLHILRGLDFSAQAGAMASIEGASGTGKSTFLHLLGGLDYADEGRIQIEGKDILAMNQARAAQFRNDTIGYVFQFHYLLQDFSALENVMMPLRIKREAIPKARKRAEQLLEEVGLKHRMSHRPAQLSGGEQQRVALARAIANAPNILLADEPTGNLDRDTGWQIMELLKKLNREKNITVLIITHNPELAATMNIQYTMTDGVLHLNNPSKMSTDLP